MKKQKEYWSFDENNVVRQVLDGASRFKEKNPNTTLFICVCAFVLVVLICVSLYNQYTAPPPAPVETYTLAGFGAWVLQLQLPAVMWVLVLGFLWLTKW